MKRRRLAALLGALALTFSVGTTAFATTQAKVRICHATDSNSNPYVYPNVNISSSGHLQGGHDTQHLGPIWTPTSKADGIVWGDIIPPYTYGDFVYPGHNWTEEGQAIYKNKCNFEDEVAHAPAIHVVKTGSVETLPPGGGSVTYTYKVTSTGNVPLSDVSVSDDKCSPVNYVSGDANSDDFLDLSETWTFTCTATITTDTTNTGTATGHDGDDTVTDTDTATVIIVVVNPQGNTPDIHLEKTVAPLNLPVGGGDVTYTYVVTNSGDEPLTSVAVTDDNGTPGDTSDDFGVDCPKTTLDIDESMTCTADVTGTTVTTTNIATASGTAGETTVSDTDDATVTVAAPGGGVQGETDVPTAPQTDTLSSTGDAGNALPILLIVLGIIGLAAVVLTPKRARR